MLNQQPISVNLPAWGVAFVESRHHPQFKMQERSDPFHKFFLVNEGRLKLHLGESEPFEVGPHTVFLVPAGIGHQLVDRTPTSLMILCVENSFQNLLPNLSPVWTALTKHLQEPVLPSSLLTQRIDSLWRRGINEQEIESKFTPINHQLLAMELMVALVQATRFPRKNDPKLRVAQLQELLEAEYYDQWTVEKAATMVQLSRRRFSDYFKQITRKSFVEYLTDIRIQKAKQLMRIGEYSISGAGFSSGFNDLSHFYRTFKKQERLTPGEWLRQQEDLDS